MTEDERPKSVRTITRIHPIPTPGEVHPGEGPDPSAFVYALNFLAAVRQRLPRVLESLLGEVFSVAEAGEAGWAETTRLDDWLASWNLDTPWMRDVAVSTLTNWSAPRFRLLDDGSRTRRPGYEPGQRWFWTHCIDPDATLVLTGQLDDVIVVNRSWDLAIPAWDPRYETRADFKTRVGSLVSEYIEQVERALPGEARVQKRGQEQPHRHFFWTALRQCYGRTYAEIAQRVHRGSGPPENTGAPTIMKAVQELSDVLRFSDPKRIRPFSPEDISDVPNALGREA